MSGLTDKARRRPGQDAPRQDASGASGHRPPQCLTHAATSPPLLAGIRAGARLRIPFPHARRAVASIRLALAKWPGKRLPLRGQHSGRARRDAVSRFSPSPRGPEVGRSRRMGWPCAIIKLRAGTSKAGECSTEWRQFIPKHRPGSGALDKTPVAEQNARTGRARCRRIDERDGHAGNPY